MNAETQRLRECREPKAAWKKWGPYLGQAVRNHWGIENRSHYVRDVTFGEDASRTRIKPTHFARFRSFAINILRANGVENVAQELYKNALNFDNALAYRVT
jgi:predicted transposase YbfD/YdcC